MVDQLINQRILNGNKPVDWVVNDFVLIAQNAAFCLKRKNSTGVGANAGENRITFNIVKTKIYADYFMG